MMDPYTYAYASGAILEGWRYDSSGRHVCLIDGDADTFTGGASNPGRVKTEL